MANRAKLLDKQDEQQEQDFDALVNAPLRRSPVSQRVMQRR